MTARVVTNNHPRPLCTWQDLPANVRPDFDYLDEDERWSDRFVKYRGEWFDVYDAQRIEQPGSSSCPFGFSVQADSPLVDWDGIATDSFWTGTVFRWLKGDQAMNYDEFGYIIVGRYIAD